MNDEKSYMTECPEFVVFERHDRICDDAVVRTTEGLPADDVLHEIPATQRPIQARSWSPGYSLHD